MRKVNVPGLKTRIKSFVSRLPNAVAAFCRVYLFHGRGNNVDTFYAGISSGISQRLNIRKMMLTLSEIGAILLTNIRNSCQIAKKRSAVAACFP